MRNGLSSPSDIQHISHAQPLAQLSALICIALWPWSELSAKPKWNYISELPWIQSMICFNRISINDSCRAVWKNTNIWPLYLFTLHTVVCVCVDLHLFISIKNSFVLCFVLITKVSKQTNVCAYRKKKRKEQKRKIVLIK